MEAKREPEIEIKTETKLKTKMEEENIKFPKNLKLDFVSRPISSLNQVFKHWEFLNDPEKVRKAI